MPKAVVFLVLTLKQSSLCVSQIVTLQSRVATGSVFLFFWYLKKIEYKKKQVSLYVNETKVLVTRDSSTKMKTDDGTIVRKRLKGEPIELRFVVEKLIDENNEIVATWILLTNLSQDAQTIREFLVKLSGRLVDKKRNLQLLLF